MQKQVFLIVAVPGSGKSWVIENLDNRFNAIEHDQHRDGYVEAILEAFDDENDKRDLVIETPFSISKIREPLEELGVRVTPVFIIERPQVVQERYFAREMREIPKGHLTRLQTYIERAQNLGAFTGTSEEVLEFLRSK